MTTASDAVPVIRRRGRPAGRDGPGLAPAEEQARTEGKSVRVNAHITKNNTITTAESPTSNETSVPAPADPTRHLREQAADEARDADRLRTYAVTLMLSGAGLYETTLTAAQLVQAAAGRYSCVTALLGVALYLRGQSAHHRIIAREANRRAVALATFLDLHGPDPAFYDHEARVHLGRTLVDALEPASGEPRLARPRLLRRDPRTSEATNACCTRARSRSAPKLSPAVAVVG